MTQIRALWIVVVLLLAALAWHVWEGRVLRRQVATAQYTAIDAQSRLEDMEKWRRYLGDDLQRLRNGLELKGVDWTFTAK